MILGIWLKRSAFEGYLRLASRKARGTVTVRLQWDPHHDLDGTPISIRRAIQLVLHLHVELTHSGPSRRTWIH